MCMHITNLTSKINGNWFEFISFYVRYSTLLYPPPLRFRCVGGCWDRTQDCCDFVIIKFLPTFTPSHPKKNWKARKGQIIFVFKLCSSWKVCVCRPIHWMSRPRSKADPLSHCLKKVHHSTFYTSEATKAILCGRKFTLWRYADMT
jgi:hypothetical protein